MWSPARALIAFHVLSDHDQPARHRTSVQPRHCLAVYDPTAAAATEDEDGDARVAR